MKIFVFFLSLCFSITVVSLAWAQTSSQQEAARMALLYAVLNVKMNDEDIAGDLEKLRNNKPFIENMQRKLSKLSNSRHADSRNQKIRKILEDAGKDIDKYL